MLHPWVEMPDGSYVAELSSLKDENHSFICPVCNKPILRHHFTLTIYDATNEDTLGWEYLHGCGTKLLISNDNL